MNPNIFRRASSLDENDGSDYATPDQTKYSVFDGLRWYTLWKRNHIGADYWAQSYGTFTTVLNLYTTRTICSTTLNIMSRTCSLPLSTKMKWALTIKLR